MRPTWCGRTPRMRRSSTTLRNRHQRKLCRLPTPARCAPAMVRSWPQPGWSTTCRPNRCGRLSPVAGRPPIGSRSRQPAGPPACPAPGRRRRAAAPAGPGRRSRSGAADRAVRSEVDPDQWMVNPPIAPNSLQLPLLFLKAGPAVGLRPPSAGKTAIA
jgi:hypothetical protein